MFVVKVWCLPEGSEKDLESLFRAIVRTAKRFADDLQVRNKRDMLCLFPSDRMSYGLGQEILVELSGRARIIIEEVGPYFGRVILEKYPKTRVICQTSSETFWDSKKQE